MHTLTVSEISALIGAIALLLGSVAAVINAVTKAWALIRNSAKTAEQQATKSSALVIFWKVCRFPFVMMLLSTAALFVFAFFTRKEPVSMFSLVFIVYMAAMVVVYWVMIVMNILLWKLGFR